MLLIATSAISYHTQIVVLCADIRSYLSRDASNLREIFSNQQHFSNMATSGRYARVDDDYFMDDLAECSGSELVDSCVSDDGKLFPSIYSAECLTYLGCVTLTMCVCCICDLYPSIWLLSWLFATADYVYCIVCYSLVVCIRFGYPLTEFSCGVMNC